MSSDAHPDPADVGPDGRIEPGDDTLKPLPGEFGRPGVDAAPRSPISKKGLLAVGLLTGGLLAVSAFAIHRFAASATRSADDGKLARTRPAAASTAPRQLEMPAPAASAASATSASTVLAAVQVPALTPTEEELAEPIGVRRTGAGAQPGQQRRAAKDVLPEDAPALLFSTRPGGPHPQYDAATATPWPATTGATPQGAPQPGDAELDARDPLAATSRNLQAYQRQLQGLLGNLTRSADLAVGSGEAPSRRAAAMGGFAPTDSAAAHGSSGLFGGQLQGSATPKVAARLLGNASLTLAKGTAFTCALTTRVISATSGLVGCQVQRNVYSADGSTVLIERGSHVDGEYRITSVKPGMMRIPVLWTRVRTPLGVLVDIESPATGKLGEAGIDGHVDNRWGERIGAAMLLSLIDDSVKLVIQGQADDRQANTVVLGSTASNTSKLAEKVLDSTINIPPLIYQNQGGIVGIYVARDVDFSTVYELAPSAALPSRP